MKRYAILLASFAFLLGLSNLAYTEELDPTPDDEIVPEHNLMPGEATVDESEPTSEDTITDDLDLTTPVVLSPQEKTAVSLYEGIMDIVNAKINASSCFIMKGKYQITLFATGADDQRKQNNMVSAKLPGNTTYLLAGPNYVNMPDASSVYVVSTRGPTSYEFTPIDTYRAIYTFDGAGETMSMTGNLELRDFISVTHRFSTLAITNFSNSSSNEIQEEYVTNIGWGMSSLSNQKFPHSKYWERIKFQRHSNDQGRTILVRDLLTLPASCRITIDTIGYNNTDYISQQGHVTVGTAIPGDPVDEFNQ